MKVFYIGHYREPSVSYDGVSFMPGVAVEVSEEWAEKHAGDKNISAEMPKQVESRPVVVTDAPFYEAPKRRGRPPKVSNDDSN